MDILLPLLGAFAAGVLAAHLHGLPTRRRLRHLEVLHAENRDTVAKARAIIETHAPKDDLDDGPAPASQAEVEAPSAEDEPTDAAPFSEETGVGDQNNEPEAEPTHPSRRDPFAGRRGVRPFSDPVEAHPRPIPLRNKPRSAVGRILAERGPLTMTQIVEAHADAAYDVHALVAAMESEGHIVRDFDGRIGLTPAGWLFRSRTQAETDVLLLNAIGISRVDLLNERLGRQAVRRALRRLIDDGVVRLTGEHLGISDRRYRVEAGAPGMPSHVALSKALRTASERIAARTTGGA